MFACGWSVSCNLLSQFGTQFGNSGNSICDFIWTPCRGLRHDGILPLHCHFLNTKSRVATGLGNQSAGYPAYRCRVSNVQVRRTEDAVQIASLRVFNPTLHRTYSQPSSFKRMPLSAALRGTVSAHLHTVPSHD